MKKLRSILTSSKFVYIIVSIAVIGILLISQIMFSKVELNSAIEPRQNIDEANVTLANAEVERDNLNVSSRSSSEERTTTTKTEEKESNDSKEETKKEVAKKETKTTTESSTTKKEATTKSSSSTKTANNSKKGSSTEDSKKETDSKKTETTENKKSATKTVSISQVKISKTMDLTKRTGLSREDFIKLISGVKADTSGFFEDNAGKIYDLCKKYSINEIFFCGLISAESGWNIASNHRRTHNYISLMKNGKLISYGSVNEGLEVAAQKLHYNYLTSGGKFYHGKTLAGVKVCFCPSSGWVDLVYGRMKQIVK